jgi:3-phosphoshikimate 1-carboxyvinyltransferase
MNYILFHPSAIIQGEIKLPRSKSLSNRALIIKALSSDSFNIENLSEANDTLLLENALKTKDGEISVQDAGTAFRFLTSYLSVTEGQFILTGSQRMKQRPIGDLVDALRKLGAKIEYLEKENKPPLKIIGTTIEGGEVKIKALLQETFTTDLAEFFRQIVISNI